MSDLAALLENYYSNPGVDLHSESASGFETYNGTTYGVIRNNYRVLEVFGFDERGESKPVEEWPSELLDA